MNYQFLNHLVVCFLFFTLIITVVSTTQENLSNTFINSDHLPFGYLSSFSSRNNNNEGKQYSYCLPPTYYLEFSIMLGSICTTNNTKEKTCEGELWNKGLEWSGFTALNKHANTSIYSINHSTNKGLFPLRTDLIVPFTGTKYDDLFYVYTIMGNYCECKLESGNVLTEPCFPNANLRKKKKLGASFYNGLELFTSGPHSALNVTVKPLNSELCVPISSNWLESRENQYGYFSSVKSEEWSNFSKDVSPELFKIPKQCENACK